VSVWRWCNIGIFSVHSCYYSLDFGGGKHSAFQSIWSASIHLKFKIFLWLVRQNKILTKKNLIKKGWQVDMHYIFCNDIETADHLFIHCSITAYLWSWMDSKI
jgi:zinc-binding in reverse transcriptase